MKFGIAIDFLSATRSVADSFPGMIETVRFAESLGFDSVWFGETHRRKAGSGHGPAPFVSCAAVAAATSRIEIGTSVVLLPVYPPLIAAEQAAMIDQISNGRFLFGVAAGLEIYKDFGFENLGVPRGKLQDIMDESLTVIRRLWTEDAVTFHGTHYRYENAACHPRPVRQPHVPILVGGITPRSIERAARLGEGWIGGTPYPHGLLTSVAADYRTACQAAGKPTGSFVSIRPVMVGPDEGEAARMAEHFIRPVLDFYLKRGAYIKPDRTAITDERDPAYATAMDDIAIVGTADGVARQIDRYAQACGLDHVIFRVRFPASTDEDIRAQLRLLAERVMPRVGR